MWTVLQGIAKLIGLGDLLAGWLHDRSLRQQGAVEQKGKDDAATVEAGIEAMRVDGANDALDDASLDAKLR